MDKRREPRIHKFLKVSLQADQIAIKASTVDISPMGMRLRLLFTKALKPAQPLKIDVMEQGRPYHMLGKVAWYKWDYIENARFAGVSLDGPHLQFCNEVLHCEIGGESLPFRRHYERPQQFQQDFSENLSMGGLFIDTPATAPDLYERVWVQLTYADHQEPFLLEGEVVAQTPKGFGLRLLNFKRRLHDLKEWATPWCLD